MIKAQIKIMRYIGLIIVPLLTFGCSVHTSFSLNNGAGQTISVFSAHTNETTIIKKGRSKIVDHTTGALLISREDGEKWNYKNLSIPDLYDSDYIVKKKKYFLIPIMRVNLFLTSEGSLYLYPESEKSHEKYKNLQPVGYPLLPERE